MGHISFLIGIDMSWFTLDAMYLIKKYHPVDGSLFEGEYEYLSQQPGYERIVFNPEDDIVEPREVKNLSPQ